MLADLFTLAGPLGPLAVTLAIVGGASALAQLPRPRASELLGPLACLLASALLVLLMTTETGRAVGIAIVRLDPSLVHFFRQVAGAGAGPSVGLGGGILFLSGLARLAR